MAFANRAAAPTRSKYSGITCADTRDPMLGLGTYQVRILDIVEGQPFPGKKLDCVKIKLQVTDSEGETPGGSLATVVCMATVPGLADLKRFVSYAAGFGPTLGQQADHPDVRKLRLEGEAAFDELEKEHGGSGSIIEASLGKANGAPSVVGRLLDVVVSRGKDTINPQTGAPTGDFYRSYRCGVVPEEHQK